jgi:predicted DNA-binding protein with PD1-like motif
LEHHAYGDQFFLRLDPGEELIESLRRFAAAGDRHGNCDMYAITSGVGMVDGVALGFFCVPRDDYDVTHIDGVLDLNTVSGNVARRDGLWVPHVHVTLNRPDYSVCGGHVMSARTHITMELWLAAPGTTGITRQTAAGRTASFLTRG